MLYQIEWNAQPSTVKGVAKQCALIAVSIKTDFFRNILLFSYYNLHDRSNFQ